LVTITAALPAAWGGVRAVIWVVPVSAMAEAAYPPTVTVAPAAKPVPVIVSVVPPATVPPLGVMAVTVGAGAAYTVSDGSMSARASTSAMTRLSTRRIPVIWPSLSRSGVRDVMHHHCVHESDTPNGSNSQSCAMLRAGNLTPSPLSFALWKW